METIREEQTTGGDWWYFLTLGILLIALGLLAIGAPFVTTLALAYVLGLILIISGIGVVIHAFKTKAAGNFPMKLLIAIGYVTLGIFLLAYPVASAMMLTLMLGVFWTITGVSKIVQAVSTRTEPNWGWMLVNGIITLILGLIVWGMWPTVSLWILGLFVGIDLIIAGWTMIALGFASHRGVFTPMYHPT